MDISTPSKLLKLKKWLTLPHAAQHLSGVCGEEVTEPDILKWALDGYLKLSVYFENTVYATPGYLEQDTLRKKLLEKGPVPEQVLKAIEQTNKCFSEYTFIESEKESVVPVDIGVFDLPMIGACKTACKISRILGKRALKSFHPRLFNDRLFAGESWSDKDGCNCRNQTASFC